MNHTSKECRLCHRVGSSNFVPSGDYGWVCALGRACARRAARRAALSGPVPSQPAPTDTQEQPR